MHPQAKVGVIFDCDGTLIDSLDHVFPSFNYAFVQINEIPPTPEQIKACFGSSADRIFARLLGSQEKGLKAFEHYIEHQTELTRKSRMPLHSGIRDLLAQLSEWDVSMAVVTGRHERDLEVALKPLAVSHFFVTQIADNHVPEPKPAPHGLKLAASRMGLDPAQTIYIGDSPMDMVAARAAGARSIAALWDKTVARDPTALLATKPNYFARVPGEVLEIVTNIQ